MRVQSFLASMAVFSGLAAASFAQGREEPRAAEASVAAPAPAAALTPSPGKRAWWSPVPDRGWLGVRLSTAPEARDAWKAERIPDEWLAVPNLRWLAEEWDGAGALIQEVLRDSPAEKAGLLPGDVILSFNGIRVQSPGVLVFIAMRALVGHDGDLEVQRDGEKRRVLVEIGMNPEDARRLEEEREAKAKGEAGAQQESDE